MTIHLSILVFFPALMGLVSAFSPRTLAPKILLIGTQIPLAYTIFMIADFDAAAGLQYVTDDAWIPELGIRYKLGVDGLNLWLIVLTTVVAFASAVWLMVRPPERAGLFAFHFGLGAYFLISA